MVQCVKCFASTRAQVPPQNPTFNDGVAVAICACNTTAAEAEKRVSLGPTWQDPGQ